MVMTLNYKQLHRPMKFITSLVAFTQEFYNSLQFVVRKPDPTHLREYCNGFAERVSKQRLCKHVPAITQQ
jgi:hypothetical protein